MKRALCQGRYICEKLYPMQLENLAVEIKENILYITINRPKYLNALNIKTIVELDEPLLLSL